MEVERPTRIDRDLRVLDLNLPTELVAIDGEVVGRASAEVVVGVGVRHGRHDEDELFLCWQGSFVVELEGGRSVPLQAGELFVVPRGTVVVLDGTSFLASARSDVSAAGDPDLPRIEITATTILGSVRVYSTNDDLIAEVGPAAEPAPTAAAEPEPEPEIEATAPDIIESDVDDEADAA